MVTGQFFDPLVFDHPWVDNTMRRHKLPLQRGDCCALSWFKPTAREHISNMRALAAILDAHGITVDVLREQRPGYIVYEDEHQVVA